GKEISSDVPPTDHVMYERGVRVTAARAGKMIAQVVEPYFDRSWKHFSSHFQTPADKVSKYAAAVMKGKVAYVAYPVFSAFANHGSASFRMLVKNILEHLLPEPLLRIDAPTSTETTM